MPFLETPDAALRDLQTFLAAPEVFVAAAAR
jgi:hypothetical protein